MRIMRLWGANVNESLSFSAERVTYCRFISFQCQFSPRVTMASRSVIVPVINKQVTQLRQYKSHAEWSLGCTYAKTQAETFFPCQLSHKKVAQP